jgi:hypothetical protein
MTRLFLVLFGTAVLCACTSNDRPVENSLRIGGQQYLLNAKDFDLQQVIALIRDNKIKDAPDLEKKINEQGGINNVDVDHDSKIDYIKIKESRKGGNVVLEFLAIPSSTQKLEDATTVASVEFSRSASAGDVQVAGGYANHVNGSENAYYTAHVHHGPSFGEMLFLSWLFMPSRPYYYAPVMPVYVARPVVYNYTPSAPRSDVKQTSKPQSFNAGSQAPKRSFASVRDTGRNRPFEARGVATPPPRPSSFQRPSRPSMRGFRRR